MVAMRDRSVFIVIIMSMKSIYSLDILQRISDHWSVGKISDVKYFHFDGQKIWRHWIETNLGEFEIYSYPDQNDPYYQNKLTNYFEYHRGKIYDEIVHSFDRYHLLVQMSSKEKISVKQVNTEFEQLVGQSIKSAYRVYGSIMQIDFSKEAVISTFANWKIIQEKDATSELLGDSNQTYEEMDSVINTFLKNGAVVERYWIVDEVTALYFSNGIVIHFEKESHFPALTMHIDGRKNWVDIFDANEIFYKKDF